MSIKDLNLTRIKLSHNMNEAETSIYKNCLGPCRFELRCMTSNAKRQPGRKRNSPLSPSSWSRYAKRISFHTSGTPGRHQWLQSGTDGLSLHTPTCASLRKADIDVTCRTVIGTVILSITSNMLWENILWSQPLVSVMGLWVTLHNLCNLSLMHKQTLTIMILHSVKGAAKR